MTDGTDETFAGIIWADLRERMRARPPWREMARLVSEARRLADWTDDMGLLGGTPKGGGDPKGPSEAKALGKHHGGNLHSNPKDTSTGKHGKDPAAGKK